MKINPEGRNGADQVRGARYGNPPGTRIAGSKSGVKLNVDPSLLTSKSSTLTREEWLKEQEEK